MRIISVSSPTSCALNLSLTPYGLCAMSKCTEPANEQTEAEHNYSVLSKPVSDVNYVANDGIQTKQENVQITNKRSAVELSPANSVSLEDDSLVRTNAGPEKKKTYWSKRPISFPSASSFYKNDNNCGSEAEEHRTNIKDKFKYLRSKYSRSNSSTTANGFNSEVNSEDLKDELSSSVQDTSFLNKPTSDDEDEARRNHLAEFRDRLRTCASGWILLLSIPRLVMLAHLQNLISVPGGGGGGKNKPPSIQPNDYMDSLLADIKASMKERGLNQLELPDHFQNGVTFYKGKVKGITNLSRQGDAKLEAATDHFLFMCTLQVKNIEAEYFWKKTRLKGEVTASVKKIVMTMEIKQKLPNESPPKLMEFKVLELENIRVKMQGLGTPMNWIVRKVLCRLLQRYLGETLEREAKPIIQQELNNVKESDLIALPMGLSSISSMIPDSLVP